MTEKKVDALILPTEKFRKGGSLRQRIHHYSDYAEPILGKPVYIRNQGNFVFVTNDPNDSIFFPVGHSLEKSPRYDWVEQEDGSQQGFLKSDPDGVASA